LIPESLELNLRPTAVLYLMAIHNMVLSAARRKLM